MHTIDFLLLNQDLQYLYQVTGEKSGVKSVGSSCYYSLSDTFNQHFLSSPAHHIFRFELQVVNIN